MTRITYVVRLGPPSADVFGTLKNDLMSVGFRPLYEAKGADFGRAQGNLFKNLAEQLFEYSPKGAHFSRRNTRALLLRSMWPFT